jgi:hypothetical protein
MATLNWKFQKNGQYDDLIMLGDYFRDWQPWKEGRGYFGRAFVPFEGGLTLCIDLHIWGRSTRRWGTRDLVNPPASDLQMQFPFGDLYFDDGKVLLRIRTQDCIEQAKGMKKQYLREDHPGAITQSGVRYRVTVAIQVKHQPADRPNVSWQPSQPMLYAGGLPETNRRRH